MAVYDDCSHYVAQTVSRADRVERCRLGENGTLPFSCPDGCIFREPRRTSSAGWQVRHRNSGRAGGSPETRPPS